MKHSFYPIIISLLALLGACSGGSKDNYQTLISTEWQLESIISDDSGDSILPQERVTILFTDSSTVSGHGGCNVFFGQYSTMGEDEIDIEVKGRSMAMCPSLELEDQIIATLDLATSYLAQQDKLQVNDLENGITLVFKPIK